jgi:hypothetical protein
LVKIVLQTLRFARLPWKNNNYTLIRERLPIFPLNFIHIPFLPELTCPNSQGDDANLDIQFNISNS